MEARAYLLVVSMAVLSWTPPAPAQDEASSAYRPQGHFRVERPADLTDAEALSIYRRILDDSVAVYRLSGDPSAARYRRWLRVSTTPYRSATHGERFVSNYANDIGRAYRAFETAGPMPVGAILAKDSFAVTARGDVFTGPLFLMEKMAPGFLPEARDWRYSMIMPDGSLFGQTKGPGSEQVAFCITCHATAGDEADHLFFVPKQYRIGGPGLNSQ